MIHVAPYTLISIIYNHWWFGFINVLLVWVTEVQVAVYTFSLLLTYLFLIHWCGPTSCQFTNRLVRFQFSLLLLYFLLKVFVTKTNNFALNPMIQQKLLEVAMTVLPSKSYLWRCYCILLIFCVVRCGHMHWGLPHSIL